MTDVVEVRLVGLPLEVHREALEHSDEVRREFAHLAEGTDPSHVPARLLALHRDLSARYAPFTAATGNQVAEAMARGDSTMDVVYRVPTDAAGAARQLTDLWEEVDRYCEAGQYLLALRTPPRVLAYRSWFVEQFISQSAGADPVDWPTWSARSDNR